MQFIKDLFFLHLHDLDQFLMIDLLLYFCAMFLSGCLLWGVLSAQSIDKKRTIFFKSQTNSGIYLALSLKWRFEYLLKGSDEAVLMQF